MRITEIKFSEFDAELRRRQSIGIHTVRTSHLLDFMRTLRGANKSSGKNGISRLQCFVNSAHDEYGFVEADPEHMSFVVDDHDSLKAHGHGYDAPDLKFVDASGNIHSIEIKRYYSTETAANMLSSTNFHAAEICLCLILSDHMWKVRLQSDNYATLYDVTEASLQLPWISQIKFPSHVTTTRFYISGDSKRLAELTDEQVPETVNFSIKTENCRIL